MQEILDNRERGDRQALRTHGGRSGGGGHPGHIEHTGKAPKKSFYKISVENEIKELKEDLDRAIKNEEYELAAQFRDKIKYLKGSID